MGNDSSAITHLKTAIAPLIFVRRGLEAVEFYKAAFGAEELFRIENDGAVVATLSVNGAEFWVADESPADGNFSPETLGNGTVRMILTVADPDAACAAPSRPALKKFGRSPTNTAGIWDAWWIRTDIIGKSADHSRSNDCFARREDYRPALGQRQLPVLGCYPFGHHWEIGRPIAKHA